MSAWAALFDFRRRTEREVTAELGYTIHESYASFPPGDEANILFAREEFVSPGTFWIWHLGLLDVYLY